MEKRVSKEDKTSKRPVSLIVLRLEAKKKIQVQLDEGERLLTLEVISEETLGDLKEKKKEWTEINVKMLRGLFNSDEIAEKYSASWGGGVVEHMRTPSLGQQVASVHSDIKTELTKLRSISNHLESFPEPNNLEGKVTFKEVYLNQDYLLQAVLNILEKEGVLTKQQVFEEMGRIKKKTESK